MCGTAAEATGRFCPECGAGFDQKPGEAFASTVPGNPESDNSRSKLVGLTIDGQFTIETVIGAGAFGTVYRGRQLGLDRPVAIKVPTQAIASDPIMAKRFAREATSAARVDHPGVVTIYAVGALSDGRPYLVMELVRGESLDKILRDGPIAPARALRIIRSIASALSETHAADVVHRDLKPSNIVWRRDRNGDDLITIVDFGIAASKPGTADATRLTIGGLLGTPHYMSPEQAHGDQVDARSDIYALGCLLFELVTGKPPFDGSGFEILLAHMGRPAPPPSELNASVPRAIDRLCETWLAKQPEQRPASADDVVQAVDATLAELAATAPPSSDRGQQTLAPRSTDQGTPTGPASRGLRRLAIAATAIAAMAVAGLGAWKLSGFATTPTTADAAGPIPNESATRQIDSDDGEIVIHVRVPDPIAEGVPSRIRIEIKNKLGQPVLTKALVLTIGDGSGTKGLTAAPQKSRGQYEVHHTFPRRGAYVLSIFPPSIDSSFEIPLEVR